ncbi:MAG: nuclease, partial [Gammaproteobacteria bacterium]|nr:nuclease [Gammaproteobacteria bacterium]
VDGQNRPILEVGSANYHREHVDDEERSEYFVPVEWLHTRDLNKAVREVGFFGNQNTVCRPRTSKWNHTVDRLKQVFGVN